MPSLKGRLYVADFETTIMDKSLGTLFFVSRSTPPLTPQTMFDACIQNFFPSFNFVWGGGRENCKKISKMLHCFNNITEKYEYCSAVPRTFVQNCS